MLRYLLVAAVLATCTPSPLPQPGPDVGPPPAPQLDGGVACLDSCCSACAVLARYSCPEARPTAKGETCAEVCRHTQASVVVALPAACVASAASRAQVEKCGVRCVQ